MSDHSSITVIERQVATQAASTPRNMCTYNNSDISITTGSEVTEVVLDKFIIWFRFGFQHSFNYAGA